jgi:hypothetical protein
MSDELSLESFKFMNPESFNIEINSTMWNTRIGSWALTKQHCYVTMCYYLSIFVSEVPCPIQQLHCQQCAPCIASEEL